MGTDTTSSHATCYAGDRLLTPWLLVLGRRGGQVPYLDVEMLRSGGRLVSVSARVLPLPAEDVARHRELVAEFVNGTHWPKHLVAHYRQAPSALPLLRAHALGAAGGAGPSSSGARLTWR